MSAVVVLTTGCGSEVTVSASEAGGAGAEAEAPDPESCLARCEGMVLICGATSAGATKNCTALCNDYPPTEDELSCLEQVGCSRLAVELVSFVTTGSTCGGGRWEPPR